MRTTEELTDRPNVCACTSTGKHGATKTTLKAKEVFNPSKVRSTFFSCHERVPVPVLLRKEVLVTGVLPPVETAMGRSKACVSAVSGKGTRVHPSVECIDGDTQKTIENALEAHKSGSRVAIVAVVLAHGNATEVIVSCRVIEEGPKAAQATKTLAGGAETTADCDAAPSTLSKKARRKLEKEKKKKEKKDKETAYFSEDA